MPHLPVPSVIFFGSPNRGLETTELESFVKGTPSQALVEELRPQSPTLENLNDKFRHVTSGISILSCYEQLWTPTAIKVRRLSPRFLHLAYAKFQMPDGRWKREGPAKLMVPGNSALLGLPGEEPLACEANHTQIAKLERGENWYYYAIKGAVLKAAGSPTILSGVGPDNTKVNNSQRLTQKENCDATQQKDDHTAETLRTRKASEDQIPEKQVNSKENLSQEGFLRPGLKTPKQLQTSVDSYWKDEVTSEPIKGKHNPRNAPLVPDTTASMQSRTALETSTNHLSQSTCKPESSGKNILSSNLPSQQQLCQAVLHRDVGLVEALVETGCSPHTSDGEAVELYQDPFLLGAKCREEKILECLLKHHANPLKNTLEHGATALHMLNMPYDALEKSVTRSLVTLLLRYGASIEARNKDGLTPLMLSARNGESKLVGYLLDGGADLKARTNAGNTALHLAAMNNHPAVVGSLISGGAPKGAKDKQGLTPLMHGCQKGHIEVLKLLLDLDLDLNARSDDGKTALHYAASEGHLSAVNDLVSRGAPLDAKDNTGVTPLMLGIRSSHRRVLKRLLELGANPNARHDDGWTPLHYAAREGHIPVICDLASRGAALEAKDGQGLTPLVVSIHFSHLQVVKHLLEVGADVNARTSLGWTPLHQAANKDYLAAADLLISKGALLEARTSKTQLAHATPLHVSTYRRDASGECTKLLLKAGADMEARDGRGETALMYAAYKGAINPLSELLASGANIEATRHTWKLWRALHTAKYYGNWQIIEVLLRSGADPFAPDIDRNIPSQLDWFRGNQHNAAPSDTDKDRCMRLLKDGEEVERQNANRKKQDRRALKKAKEQQDKLKRCSIEALKDEEEFSEKEPETHKSRQLKPPISAKNIDKQKRVWTRSRP